jgi:photosystem II stability/assembly factor-like uncharacterized protein
VKNNRALPRKRPQQYLAAGFSVASAAILSCQAIQTRVYASPNTYSWTNQEQDPLGGTYASVSSSTDGSHLIMGSREGGEGFYASSPLFISNDSGATWTDVASTVDSGIRDYWKSVDVTDNGMTMVAASDSGITIGPDDPVDGKIFISQNAGVDWTDITPAGISGWHNVAISGNGSKIVATADNDRSNVYISTNGGTSWTTKPFTDVNQWESLSISDNGGTILVGGENGSASSFDDISTNGGTTWTDVSPDGGNMVFATRTALSADASKIAISTYGNNGYDYAAVHVSTNGGSSWTDVSPTGTDSSDWNAIAMSGDGGTLAVEGYTSSDMYVSHDNGVTWNPEAPGTDSGDTNNWESIDFSNDGSRAIAASDANAYVGYNAGLNSTPPSATVTNAESSTPIVVTTPQGTTITCHTGVKESDLTAQDGAYTYPVGLVDFCFSGADTSNAITLTFVTDLKPGDVAVRKYNPTTKTFATVTAANVTETTYNSQHALQVTYTIADNGPLDTDPATGEVSDPVGLAVLNSTTPTTLTDTGVEIARTATYSAAIIAGASFVALKRSKIRQKTFRLFK